MGKNIPIEISARHIHLSQTDLDILFGQGYELTVLKDLSQPGQYAANETVKIIGSKGEFGKVRVLGPVREKTQIEISKTDAKELGIDPPVRDSGNLAGTPGVKIEGPQGSLELREGVILALRHIHIDPKTAQELGITDGDLVRVKVGGDREIVFDNVLARVNENFKLAMHVDTDEANAAGVDRENNQGELILSE